MSLVLSRERRRVNRCVARVCSLRECLADARSTLRSVRFVSQCDRNFVGSEVSLIALIVRLEAALVRAERDLRDAERLCVFAVVS